MDLEREPQHLKPLASHVRISADLREFDARGGWHVQGAATCAHWLAWRVGWDLVTARDPLRVARKLAEFALVDDALRRGELSYSKVRAVLRVATSANEALLVDHARLMTASQLEKMCRQYALVQQHGKDNQSKVDEQRRHVRRRDLEDGMVKIEAVLHPEEAELVWTMLDHAASRLAREAAAAAAPQEAANRTSAESRSGASADSPGTDSHDAADGCPPGSPGDPDSPPHASQGTLHPSADLRVPHEPGPQGTVRAVAGAVLSAGSAESTIEIQASSYSDRHEVDDSAESRVNVGDLAACPEVCERSLLDRLLDEAEALRSAEAAAPNGTDAARGDELAPAPHNTRAAQEPSQLIGRNASVLRDRAAVARKAFNRADALVELAQGYLRGDRPDRPPIEVTLTIPACVLRDESADPIEVGELGEALLSRETARRLSCDAGVVEILEDEQGAPLSVGRKRRTIAGALRRALHRRDRSCTFPGCTNRRFLEGHHIQHWADGGETSLSNTALLCSLHHRHVHELGYAIELGPDQRPRFRDPQGRLVPPVPEPAAPEGLGWPRIRAENEPLGIDATTIAGPWDGTPVDYARIVGHLATAEGLT